MMKIVKHEELMNEEIVVINQNNSILNRINMLVDNINVKNSKDIIKRYLYNKYVKIRLNTISQEIEFVDKKENIVLFTDRLVNTIYCDLSDVYITAKKADDKIQLQDGYLEINDYLTMLLNKSEINENDYSAFLSNYNKRYKSIKHNIIKNDIYSYIDSDEFSEEYNPLEELFANLEVPNTQKLVELDKLLECLEFSNDCEVVKNYFYAFFAGVFTNLFDNSKYFDSILILQSSQGIGKTTLINKMTKLFEKYTATTFSWNCSDKDELAKLRSNLIIFDDELSATTKGKIEDIKKITSMTNISYRKAYGKLSENFKRISSFIGATNSSSIINDITGSRRFLILELLKIDSEKLKEVDFEKLWGECYNYFHIQENVVYLDFEKINNENETKIIQTSEEVYLSSLFDLNSKETNVELPSTKLYEILTQNGYRDVNQNLAFQNIKKVMNKYKIETLSNKRIGKIKHSTVYKLYQYNLENGNNIDLNF